MSKRFHDKQSNEVRVPPEDNRKRGDHRPLLLNFQNYSQWKKVTSSELIISYGSLADFTNQEGDNIVLYKPERPVRDWTVIGQSSRTDVARNHSSSASARGNSLSADQVPLPQSENGDEISNKYPSKKPKIVNMNSKRCMIYILKKSMTSS